MINENIINDEDFIKINKEIDEIGKTIDIWYLKYYFSRLQEKYDILITNRDVEIKNLKDSYIKIRFTGKNLDEKHKDENALTLITGISSSSAIIGNTVFGKGKFKDIRDNFILDKRTLSLLLIDPSVRFYVLRGADKIEIIESSNDIVATLEEVLNL